VRVGSNDANSIGGGLPGIGNNSVGDRMIFTIPDGEEVVLACRLEKNVVVEKEKCLSDVYSVPFIEGGENVEWLELKKGRVSQVLDDMYGKHSGVTEVLTDMNDFSSVLYSLVREQIG
jgi:hypothetical protein